MLKQVERVFKLSHTNGQKGYLKKFSKKQKCKKKRTSFLNGHKNGQKGKQVFKKNH